ncbi:hypothetical protein [Konateibacter massiliensis]|uniref:hypothetical protein n=1 Tax=Konateibacter massiliensis TaxID=2002841 RepID=UPI000C14DCF9|nr:hypothetical protein [Konateibacter massiliensis]
MNKPGPRFIIVFNLVLNFPMAFALSVTAPILMGQEVFTLNLVVNVLIGFILACMINMLLPIQKISMGFPSLFKINPESFAGRFVGNIPVCLIFVLIIGFILTAYNVRQVPAFLFAFIGTFIPIYVVCFIVSMIFLPIAMKAGMAADKKVNTAL